LHSKGASEQEVIAALEATLKKDHLFQAGRVLSSMCTSPHELAIKAHMMFIESNLGNPDLYPGTKQLEQIVIQQLSDLFHGNNISGHMTSGGTEANITALWIARKLTGKREVIYPKSAHFSIIKAIDMLNMVPIEIGLDDQYRFSIDDCLDKASENTAAIICMAGTTELGVIDPIEKLSKLCHEKYYLHVDGAFGGFVIPFLKELGYTMPKFDFELPNVSSFCTDPHKMGLSTMPAGVLLYRDKQYLDHITVEAPYLVSMKHTTLTGTKGSGAVAAIYAVLRYLGREGYKKVVKECMDNTLYFQNGIQDLGLEPINPPVMNVLAIKLRDPKRIQHELSKQNWFVSKSRYPKGIRFVIMPHVTRTVIDNFLPVFEKTCREQGEL
jgi:tyrosine decarboxylase/aspartate 1-decarboxylase